MSISTAELDKTARSQKFAFFNKLNKTLGRENDASISGRHNNITRRK